MSQKAYATIGTKLYYKKNASWVELVKIKSYPDLGGAPEKLETTDLTDAVKTYVLGVQDLGDMAFVSNYNADDFKKVNDLAKQPLEYKLAMPDGSAFLWNGEHTVYHNGGSVNAVEEMTINMAPSSAISYEEPIEQCATVTFTPADDTFATSVSVTLACATTGASIYYTLDGTTPTSSSTLYSTTISLTATKTIKAIAIKSGMADSEVASKTYTKS